MDLPLEAPATAHTWTPKPAQHRILITGAAGAVASLIAPHLAKTHELIGLDVVTPPPEFYETTHTVNLTDTKLLHKLVAQTDVVIHLATGAARGTQGLYEVDVDATNWILAAAIDHGVHRVVLASSNHVAGWYERQWLAGKGNGHVKPWDPPRPDGAYGAAKAHMEALGRFASDSTGLPVSILRIGTMRSTMSLQQLIDSAELPYLGFGTNRAERLARTWLTAQDLVDMLYQELGAVEPFRLRYATSTPDQLVWDHTVYTG